MPSVRILIAAAVVSCGWCVAPAWAAPDATAPMPSTGAAAPAAAPAEEESISTDRPDFTNGTDTIPLGKVQLEGGYSYSRQDDAKEHDLGELELRVPMTKKSEAQIYLNSYTWLNTAAGRATGFQDAGFGFKYRFREGSEHFKLLRPTLGVQVTATAPTGAAAFSEKWQPRGDLLMQWQPSKKFEFSSNLGATHASQNGVRYNQSFASLSGSYQLTKRTGSFLETYGLWPEAQGGIHRQFVDGGFTYLLRHNLQVDTHAGFAINGGGLDYIVGAGAGYLW